MSIVLLRPAYSVGKDRASIRDGRINDWSRGAIDSCGSTVLIVSTRSCKGGFKWSYAATASLYLADATLAMLSPVPGAEP
jgi:hypothetical protein